MGDDRVRIGRRWVLIDVGTPLLRSERDWWGRCCPRGGGCNLGGGMGQPCHLLAADRLSSDRQSVRWMRYWWRLRDATPGWRWRQRRRLLGYALAARDTANAAPSRPPAVSRLRPIR